MSDPKPPSDRIYVSGYAYLRATPAREAADELREMLKAYAEGMEPVDPDALTDLIARTEKEEADAEVS